MEEGDGGGVKRGGVLYVACVTCSTYVFHHFLLPSLAYLLRPELVVFRVISVAFTGLVTLSPGVVAMFVDVRPRAVITINNKNMEKRVNSLIATALLLAPQSTSVTGR